MRLKAGDHVEWQSHFSNYIFRGVIEGFFGKDKGMAFCTDQTGLPSRPVQTVRLSRTTEEHWYSGQVA